MQKDSIDNKQAELYEAGGTIFAGNCAEILPGLKEGFVDLTVTSPPYDSMRKYRGFDFDFMQIAKGLWHITKPGGVVVWVVGDETIKGSETGTSFKQALGFMEIGFRLFDTMIYQKTGTSFGSEGRYTQLFEYMFVFSKGAPKTFNPICDIPKLWEGSFAPTTQRQQDGSLKVSKSKNCGKAKSGRIKEIHFVCPNCKYEGTLVEAKYGYKQRTNIWRIVNGKGFGHKDPLAYEHPATFPAALARDHILTWSNPEDMILDPMCGSGTTLVEAFKLGRRYLGIDISEEYCNLSQKRLDITTNTGD